MSEHYLDTSVCIDYLRGRLGSGYRQLRTSSPASFKLPAVVVAELHAAAMRTSNPSKHLRLIEEFVETFEVVPFSADCAREYSRIRYDLQHQGRHGRMIGERDMMIAATACANRATLVATDSRDFLRVTGLRLESWGD